MATTPAGEAPTTDADRAGPGMVPLRRERPAAERWWGWLVEQLRFMVSLPLGRQQLVTRRAIEALMRTGVRTEEVTVTLVVKPSGMVLVVEVESTGAGQLYGRYSQQIGLYVQQSLRRRYGLVLERVLFIGSTTSQEAAVTPPGPISAEWLYRSIKDARGPRMQQGAGSVADSTGLPAHLQSQPMPAAAPLRPPGLAQLADPGFEVQSLPADAMDAFFSATVPADGDGERGARVA